MANYIADTDLEAYLGRALTAAEDAQFPAVAAAVTQVIDRYTGRTWDGSGVTGELHTLLGPTVTLARPPVTAVTQVRARAASIGATWRVLTAGSEYELLDPGAGLLAVAGPGYGADVITTDGGTGAGSMVEVSYTVPGTVPAPVKLAAEQLAAGLLAGASAAANQAQGIKRYSVGGELTVEYFDEASTDSAALPAAVRSLLDQYRRPVVFA